MEDKILIEFGKHLKKLRTERQMTQLDVAIFGDFDRNYIGMVERGERNPSLKNLNRIAKALDISLPELLDF